MRGFEFLEHFLGDSDALDFLADSSQFLASMILSFTSLSMLKEVHTAWKINVLVKYRQWIFDIAESIVFVVVLYPVEKIFREFVIFLIGLGR